jgi:hypothetical protein
LSLQSRVEMHHARRQNEMKPLSTAGEKLITGFLKLNNLEREFFGNHRVPNATVRTARVWHQRRYAS